MNITLIQEPIPGGQLAALGFTTDTPARVTCLDNSLSVTIVTDEAEWREICEASSLHLQDSWANWVRENGEVIIGGDWLTGFGITEAEQLEVTTAPGVIRLQRR